MKNIIKLVYNDLKSLTFTIKFILIGLLFLTFFSYLKIDSVNDDLLIGLLKSLDFWKIIGILSSGTSILCVLLIANRKLSNFFWGVFSCIFYGLYCWKYQYFGDLLTNIFWYLPMCFYGWKCWNKGYNNKIGKIFKNKFDYELDLPILVLLTTIFFTFFVFINPLISEIGNDWKGYGQNYDHYLTWRHFADAFTSMGAIVSTIFLNARLPVDNIYYLLMNPLSMAMWIYYADLGMVITYATYFVIAIMGYYDWFYKK